MFSSKKKKKIINRLEIVLITSIYNTTPEDPEKTRRSLCFEQIHIYRVNELSDLYKRLQEEEGLERSLGVKMGGLKNDCRMLFHNI